MLQREDGGWGQLPKMDTDAYATATALVALPVSVPVLAADTATIYLADEGGRPNLEPGPLAGRQSAVAPAHAAASPQRMISARRTRRW